MTDMRMIFRKTVRDYFAPLTLNFWRGFVKGLRDWPLFFAPVTWTYRNIRKVIRKRRVRRRDHLF